MTCIGSLTEAIVAYSYYYPRICVEELRKDMKTSVGIANVGLELRTSRVEAHIVTARTPSARVCVEEGSRKRLVPTERSHLSSSVGMATNKSQTTVMKLDNA